MFSSPAAAVGLHEALSLSLPLSLFPSLPLSLAHLPRQSGGGVHNQPLRAAEAKVRVQDAEPHFACFGREGEVSCGLAVNHRKLHAKRNGEPSARGRVRCACSGLGGVQRPATRQKKISANARINDPHAPRVSPRGRQRRAPARVTRCARAAR